MLKIVEINSEEHFNSCRSKEITTNDYLYICKYNNSIKLSDNGELKEFNGVNLSNLEGNAIKQQEDGTLYVEDKTEIIQKLETITNSISRSQKYLNTELDYCYLMLSNTENADLSVGYVLPFTKVNGNMKTNETNYSITLKAGKTYKISADIHTATKGYCGFSIFDVTNNKQIITFIKSAASYDTTASNTNGNGIYIPENDCEIQIKVTFQEGKQRIYSTEGNYFIVEEIGRVTTIDPVEHINTTQGLEDTPVGHIISYMGTKAPKHYLICDGSEYNIADYPHLAQCIADSTGSINYFGGDGVTTFAVPKINSTEEDNDVYGLVPKMINYSSDICKVTQDSEHSYNGYYVFDRNDTTGWLSNSYPSGETPGYVQVQFTDGKDRVINKISLRNYMYNSIYRCKDFELQASKDGVKFDTLLTSTLPNDHTKYYDYEITSTEAYSIFRIAIKTTYGASNYNFGLGDVRLFGNIASSHSYSCIKYEPTYFMNVFGLREETVLFEGTFSTGSIDVLESIENYDELHVFTGKSNSNIIKVSEISYGVSRSCIVTELGSGNYSDSRVGFHFDNNKIATIDWNGGSNAITKIIGIKYRTTPEGTITSGPSYTNEEISNMVTDILGGEE